MSRRPAKAKEHYESEDDSPQFTIIPDKYFIDVPKRHQPAKAPAADDKNVTPTSLTCQPQDDRSLQLPAGPVEAWLKHKN